MMDTWTWHAWYAWFFPHRSKQAYSSVSYLSDSLRLFIYLVKPKILEAYSLDPRVWSMQILQV